MQAEGEPGREDAIDETLEQGRHGSPPVGVDEYQVLGPDELRARLGQVGFVTRCILRAGGVVEIEIQVAKAQDPDLLSALAGAAHVGLGERPAQAGVVGVTQDDQDLHARSATPCLLPESVRPEASNVPGQVK